MTEANSTLRTRNFKRDPETSKVICRLPPGTCELIHILICGEGGRGNAINYASNIRRNRKKFSRPGFEYYCSKRISQSFFNSVMILAFLRGGGMGRVRKIAKS